MCVRLLLPFFAVLLTSKEVRGQTIYLKSIQFNSQCDEGLIANVDSIVLTFEVGPNYPAHENAGWAPSVSLEIRRNGASKFNSFCGALIGNGGSLCNPSPPPGVMCYCVLMDGTSGLARIVANITAKLAYSGAEFRAKWQDNKGNIIYSDKNGRFSRIYDATRTTTELTINNQSVRLYKVNFIVGQDNYVEYKVSGTVSPRNPRIRFDGITVADGQGNSSSASYTFTAEANKTINVTASYSLCSRKDSDYVTTDSYMIGTA